MARISIGPVERKFLGKYAFPLYSSPSMVTKKSLFIAESNIYKDGDEHVLPYPERSKQGRKLVNLAQQLHKSSLALVLEPIKPEFAKPLAKKLIKNWAGASVYVLSRAELSAAIEDKSPFDFWRYQKPNLPGMPAHPLVVLNPPKIENTDEWAVAGAWMPSLNVHTVSKALREPWRIEGDKAAEALDALSAVGLLLVEDTGNGLWLHRTISD